MIGPPGTFAQVRENNLLQRRLGDVPSVVDDRQLNPSEVRDFATALSGIDNGDAGREYESVGQRRGEDAVAFDCLLYTSRCV